jgi:hypothetical protein
VSLEDEGVRWQMPDGTIGSHEDVLSWYEEQAKLSCPYFIQQNGGPTLMGVYGPGTCGGGCWEEPRCMTG